MQKLADKKIDIRYSKSSLILLELVIGLILLPYIIIGIKRPTMILSNGIWVAILVCLVSALFIFVWLNAFKIQVENNVLKYSSLFREKEILVKDIDEVKIEVGGLNYFDKFRPSVRLVIKYKPDFKVLDINLKVFSKKDITTLLKFLSFPKK